MGLQAVYERFLQSPNSQNLAGDATLQYVTTLKTFSQQDRIIKHLQDQNNNVVRKKSEKIISAVEGLTSVAVITETTLEFVSDGGAYLPGMDTFILDRVVTLPVTHFVHFNPDNKIAQIRLSWDQGDLLKQVEVIGSRGKNWPVCGGKDQIKMITASTSTANESNPAPSLSPRGRNQDNGNGVDRSMSPSKKYIKDPHTSLDVFRQEDERRPSAPNPVAPREAHRPADREMSDIFAAGHEDYQPSGPGRSPRKESKDNVVAPKGAGHKRFQPSEVFAEEIPAPKERQIYKTNPARYNHFDIGDHDDDDHFQHRSGNVNPQDMPIRPKGGRVTQHAAQWDFGESVTPEKAKQQKIRSQDVVHFSYRDGEDPQPMTNKQTKSRKDAETHFEFQDNGTPKMRETHPQPRKDVNSHFTITDEASPAPQKTIIARTKAAAKIYSDPIFGEDEGDSRPLAGRSGNARKDLSSQWDLNDDLAANGKPSSRGQARKGLDSSWGVGDEDTTPRQQPVGRGRKDANKGFWDF